MLLLLFTSLFLTVPALAQHGLFLSNQADFSTDDHVFAAGETIYIKVEPGVELDVTAVTESEFELEPVLDGEDYESTLALQDDGSFTASVAVDDLEGLSPTWLLEISIEDEFGHGYEARTSIVLSGREPGDGEAGGDGDEEDEEQEEDEEEEDDEEEAEDEEEDEEEGDDEGEEEEDENENSQTLRGTITSIGADGTVTVGQTSFSVTSSTEIRGERGAVLTFEALEVGMFARAHLTSDAEGNLTAERIKVDRRFEEEDVKVTGPIEAVSATEITIRGITFLIDEHTEIEARGDEEIEVTDLVVGQVVRVEGEMNGDGQLVADEIKVRGRLHNEGRYAGLVTAVSEGSIEVNGLAFSVTEETIVEGAASVDEIAIGQHVRIRYRLLGDGSRFALRIRVTSDSEDENEAELTGVIDAIDGDIVFIADIEVIVTVDTQIHDEDGTAITAADLEVGQTVEVEGTATADGVVATSIKVEESVVVSGSVETQESAAIEVAGTLILIDGETLIVGRNNVQVPASALATGTFVEVIAVSRTEESAGKTGGGDQMTAERILVMEGSSSTTIEDGDKTVPDVFTLKQNYPNPFNPSTTITFEISRADAQAVTLVVYDVLGRHVRTLVDGTLPSGHYSYVWNGRDDSGHRVASGLYLYRLQVDEHTAVRSMTFMK